MTTEADLTSETWGQGQPQLGPVGGSSTEPPATQIKMPDSGQSPRPRMRTRSQSKTLDSVEHLLHNLMSRLDENDRRYGEALGGLNERLNDLSERAQTVHSDQMGDAGATLERVQQQASSLAEQVSAADTAHRAMHSAPSAPDHRTSYISDTNDDLHRPDFGDNRLNQDFANVTKKLEQSFSNQEPAKDFGALSQHMDALAQRFDAALEARNDLGALEKIESQLNAITANFAEAQRNYAKVDAIEGHLINLMRWAESSDKSNQNNNDDSRLEAIEHALNDLSNNAREMDTRTVSTLEAMNQALHSLAAHTDTSTPSDLAIDGALPQTEPQPVRAPLTQHLQDDYAEAWTDESHKQSNQPTQLSNATTQPKDNLGATIPDYQPPSSKSKAVPEFGTTAAKSVPKTDAPQETDATYEADSDFIASARRAAAAAALQPSATMPKSQVRKKWNLASAAERFSSGSSRDEKRTRPVLVAAAIALLVVSAGLLYSRLQTAPDTLPNLGTSELIETKPATPVPETSDDKSPTTKKSESAPTAPNNKNSASPSPRQNKLADPKPRSGRMLKGPTTRSQASGKVPKSFPSPKMPGVLPQGRATATGKQNQASPPVSRAAMKSRQPISTATLLASLPSEVREPQMPGVTMAIKEPASRSSATRMGNAADAVAPALVPSTGTFPPPNSLPQPKRAPAPATTPSIKPAQPGAIDSAPANEVSNGSRGRQSAMPPARIGPQSLRVAAARGNPAAQVEIASRFAKGVGVPKDLKQAVEWYGRAAAQGHAPAQYRLAALHERGQGVKKDTGVARTWYRRAAELGNIRAMHNLAVLYTRREAGGPDYTSAKNWFYQAARHGLADSQFNLGILYESGLGARKNSAEAYKWFSLAAQKGDSEARKRRESIRPQLPAKSLNAAEKSIRSWKSAPANEAANDTGPPRGGWQNAQASKATTVSNPALVSRAQTLLNKLGYDAGVADGRIGPQTLAAIRKFEIRSGSTVTGIVSPALLRRLEALAS